MKKYKKILILLLVLPLIFGIYFDFNLFFQTAKADIEEKEYVVYDDHGEYVNYGYDCEVGDMFISDSNILYEIIYVDDVNSKAFAKAKVVVTLPKVEKNSANIKQIKTYQKKIGMYHTHNDESYVLGDGYDSVYGKGGIVDIGDRFAEELKKFNINIYKNDTLHLPHDGNAYVRSKKTAQQLLTSQDLDAIFDVHRDGVPRKQFLGEVNGKTLSKIRIVIGKSNPTYSANLDFALALKAYADEKYPGLIKDIYIGSGRYNQNLLNKAILFEMGTYLIEKNYVEKSLPYLADTIDKVLYTDVVDSQEAKNDFLEKEDVKSNDEIVNSTFEDVSVSRTGLWVILALLIVGFGILGIIKKKRRKENK